MIYLDHNATCPPNEVVKESILNFISTAWGNPSSSYNFGRQAKRAVEDARQNVASFINAQTEQVLFTSGATESINSALNSAILAFPGRRHIVTSEVEHSAVISYCDHLERSMGYDVTRLRVDSNGELPPERLEAALRPDTALVSLIWANNETGVIWPVSDFAEVCHAHDVPLHVDGVQAVGKISVDFEECGADYLSLSGHKLGGAKGSGALLVRQPESYIPLIRGGKQERGLRGGTENVPLYVALGEAAKLCRSRAPGAWDQITKIRDTFEEKIAHQIPGAKVHGKTTIRLPNTISLYLPGIDSDAAVTYLDQKGICVSSGSACMESAITPSHVIYAMSRSHDISSETLRISLGLESTKEELDHLASELVTLAAIYS